MPVQELQVQSLFQEDPLVMKEIEEQILARKDELNASVAKKSKPASTMAVEKPTEDGGAGASEEDVLASFDENFEEFTPAEE